MTRLAKFLLLVALVAGATWAQGPDPVSGIDPSATPRQQAAQALLQEARELRAADDVSAAIERLLRVLEMRGNELTDERFDAISQINDIEQEGRDAIAEATLLVDDGEPELARQTLDRIASGFCGTQAAMRADQRLDEMFEVDGGHALLWTQVEEELAAGRVLRARNHLRKLLATTDRDAEDYSKVVEQLSAIRTEHQAALDEQMAATMILEGRGLMQRESYEAAYQRFDFVTKFYPDHPACEDLERHKDRCVAELAKQGLRYEFELHNGAIIDGVVLWRRNGQVAVQVTNGVVFLNLSDVAAEKAKD